MSMNWFLEPGHTAAEFSVRHMMVTHVRGHFKNIHGKLRFDVEKPRESWVSVEINTRTLWSGEAERDAHLRSPDFLDVERYPSIRFEGDQISVLGCHEYSVTGQLTIRGVTRTVPLRVTYLGQWGTPWWEDGVDKGPKTRAGFTARTEIDRRDFGVNWNSPLTGSGVVVGNTVQITIDAEAILDEPNR
jgi:polyisoprenoid-binding protein YceI